MSFYLTYGSARFIPPVPVGGGGSLTPTLVQHFDSSGTSTAAATETSSAWTYRLPTSIGAGNCIVFCLTYPNGTAPTITDNNSNSWTGTLAGTTSNVGGNDTSVWVLPNAKSGYTSITATFGAAQQPVWAKISEWSGIATTSPTNGFHSTAAVASPTLAVGSFTPTNAGSSLILAYFNFADGGSAAGNPNTWADSTSVGGPFTLNDANIQWITNQGIPSASMYWVQSAQAAVNPTMTTTGDSVSDHYNCTAVALKASSGAGTAPLAFRIVKHLKQVVPNLGGATSLVCQVPVIGNFRMFLTSADSAAVVISSVTDSNGNTWVKDTQPTAGVQGYHFKNTSANANLKVTIHFGSTSNNFDILWLDIIGAHAVNPIGTIAAGPNTGLGAGVTTAPHMPDITPSANNSIIAVGFENGLGPTTAITSPSGAVIGNVGYSGSGTGESDSGNINSGDGFGTLYNTSTTAQNWTWTVAPNAATVDALAIEILSA